MNWLTDNKIPLGAWMESFVDWLVSAAASVFFDFISITLETIIYTLVDSILWAHPLLSIAVILIGVWFLHRNIGLLVFIAASFLLIINMGYWIEAIPNPCSGCGKPPPSVS